MSSAPRPTVREKLLSVLEGMRVAEDPIAASREFQRMAIELGTATIFAALSELMETTTDQTRSFACSLAIKCKAKAAIQRRAVVILREQLGTGPLDSRLMAAFWISHCSLGEPKMVPLLESLLEATPRDDYRCLWVAGALFRAAGVEEQFGESRSRALRALRHALRSDDASTVVMAAVALDQEQVDVEITLAALRRAYEIAAADMRAAIVGHILRIDPDSRETITFLMRIVRDGTLDHSERVAATVALGRSSKEFAEVDAALRELFSSGDWELANFAVVAISQRHGSIPSEEISTLIKFLSHPDYNHRGMAAAHLASLPSQIEPAIPMLLRRLEEEPDRDVEEVLVRALGSGGKPALAALVAAIPQTSLRTMPLVQYAIFQIGRAHPAAIGELLLSANARTREIAGWVLHSLGPTAAPAIPLAVSLLESQDVPVLIDALIALSRLGNQAVGAAPRLGELLLHADSNVRQWAEEVLLAIGMEALPALQAQRQTSGLSSDIKEVLDRVIGRLTPVVVQHSTAAAQGVDGVTSIADLQLFVGIVDLVTEHGPLSLRQLEAEFERLDQLGEVPEGVKYSFANIRLVLKRLEQAWTPAGETPIRLLDQKRNAKGKLTPIAMEYAQKVAAYLRSLEAAEVS